MDGRKVLSLAVLALVLSSTGCLSTQNSGSDSGASAGGAPRTDIATGVARKEDGPRRDPKPSTEVKIGEVKEMEADCAEGKKHPDIQARLRDEARQAYQHAIQLDPNCIEGHRRLGSLYAKMGDYERAMDTYKKIMAKHPKDATLWYELGQVHNRRKDFHEGMICFQKALEFAPENRDYMKTLGFTLARMGQTDQALVYLKRAQGASLAHYNLAQMLLHCNEPELAAQQLRLSLRENAQFEPARELLTRIETPATASVQTAATPR